MAATVGPENLTPSLGSDSRIPWWWGQPLQVAEDTVYIPRGQKRVPVWLDKESTVMRVRIAGETPAIHA